jgi:hypothetical protein
MPFILLLGAVTLTTACGFDHVVPFFPLENSNTTEMMDMTNSNTKRNRDITKDTTPQDANTEPDTSIYTDRESTTKRCRK